MTEVDYAQEAAAQTAFARAFATTRTLSYLAWWRSPTEFSSPIGSMALRCHRLHAAARPPNVTASASC